MSSHPKDREDLEIATIASSPNVHSQQLLDMSPHPMDREGFEIAAIATSPNDHT